MQKYIYNENYKNKITCLIIVCVLLTVAQHFWGYELFVYPTNKANEYHGTILTVNSILSGFSLTNLGVLINISSDQLIEKIKGTDILTKRNTVILHSVIFGVISIFSSLLFIVKFHRIDNEIFLQCAKVLKIYIYDMEIISLIISIAYFLLSVKKMTELISYVYVPKKIYTKEKIDKISKQMDKSVKNDKD